MSSQVIIERKMRRMRLPLNSSFDHFPLRQHDFGLRLEKPPLATTSFSPISNNNDYALSHQPGFSVDGKTVRKILTFPGAQQLQL